MVSDSAAGPLAGIRVVELASARVALAGRILSDLGADVIVIEPPGGSELRRLPPFAEHTQDEPGASLYWAAVALGKRSIVLDVDNPPEQERLRILLQGADVLLEAHEPGVLDARDLGYEQIRSVNPRLIYVSVTPYGQTRPEAHSPATDLTVEAAGGLVGLQGDGDRPPVPVGFPQASFHAGAQAAADTIIALNERERSGLGQHLDVSMQAAVVWTLMNATGYPPNTGGDPPGTGAERAAPRREPVPGIMLQALWPCADGYVTCALGLGSLGGATLQSILRHVEGQGLLPAALAGREWRMWLRDVQDGSLDATLARQAIETVRTFLARSSKRELAALAVELGLLLAPINTTLDLLADDQLQARDYWQTIDGRTYPGPFARLSRTPIRLRAGAPALDDGDWEGSGAMALAFSGAPLAAPPDPQFWGSLPSRQPPTSGKGAYSSALVRNEDGAPQVTDSRVVLDAAGSGAPRIGGAEPNAATAKERYSELEGAESSADLAAPSPSSTSVPPIIGGQGAGSGASRAQPFAGLRVADFAWVGVGPLTSKAFADHGATVVHVETATRPDILRTLPPFKDGVPGLDRGQFMANFNSSKLGLALNLSSEQGRELARRLIAWADVVVESFTPGTMQGWGLDYASLSHERPELIMVSTCLRGQTGPQRGYAGFGGQGAALAGLHAITGWPDRPPSGPWGAYTDFIAPRYAVSALASALYHRTRTGEGQHVDLSQVEAGIHFIEPLVLDYTVNGRVAPPAGQSSLYACPHAAFPVVGTERYVAIAVETAEQWQALCTVAPLDQFSDPGFDVLQARIERRGAIEETLRCWTQDKDAWALAGQLKAAGVPAAVVARPSDLYEDPQLAHRGFFVPLEHSVMGRTPYDGPATIFSATPARLSRPGPCLGEHTYEVLADLLGLSSDEIAGYAADGVLS